MIEAPKLISRTKYGTIETEITHELFEDYLVMGSIGWSEIPEEMREWCRRERKKKIEKDPSAHFADFDNMPNPHVSLFTQLVNMFNDGHENNTMQLKGSE